MTIWAWKKCIEPSSKHHAKTPCQNTIPKHPAQTKRPYEEIKRVFKEAAENSLKGVLFYTEEAVVSQDFVGSPHTSNFDANAGIELSPTFYKIISWYDNEYGYSTKLVELMAEIHNKS